ncbi:EcsC family protein [Nitrosococcus wardiae]|uniref:EcsC family protein n=2 Tax=Nitrosococcus wardiae TaxID=1814290 RepID=A0A4P7C6M8_9GAMM|nr:EcsC family protein [Nitrosococcus wardiae]
MHQSTPSLSPQDLIDLRWAHRHLEHPSFAARLSNVVGTPIEQGLKLLPKSWHQHLHEAVEFSIRRALDMTISSMGGIPPSAAHDHLHKFMAMGSGAIGGLFGPLTLLAELPITTALMLRSIADIAHSQGEDLNTLEARLACMEVFALGGRTKEDDAADTGYYGIRATLAFHFSGLLDYPSTATKLPAAINLIRATAARFGVVIPDKAAAQMIPAAGAVSGALLNLIFMQHFQDMARGHFIVRRLERKYDPETVRVAYQQLTQEEAKVRLRDLKASPPGT